MFPYDSGFHEVKKKKKKATKKNLSWIEWKTGQQHSIIILWGPLGPMQTNAF